MRTNGPYVDARAAILLRLHRRDWLILLALAALLIALLVLPNSLADALAENAAQDAADRTGAGGNTSA
ncbi:MAG: hypothetical protein U0670_18660 [Anaerolineae bacterium]